MNSFKSKINNYFLNNYISITSILIGLCFPIFFIKNFLLQILSTIIIYILFLIAIEFFNIKQKKIQNTSKWTIFGISIQIILVNLTLIYFEHYILLIYPLIFFFLRLIFYNIIQVILERPSNKNNYFIKFLSIGMELEYYLILAALLFLLLINKNYISMPNKLIDVFFKTSYCLSFIALIFIFFKIRKNIF